ncbi:Asr1405/Asl0597 family protein [Coleofasciculus sp.]|uniref:Asr1405/Asl0597 family protein n=1 Tax=Coleofasciculus sp. TaxID=3100458 RepID=UPI003A3A6794
MNPWSFQPKTGQVIDINQADRWQVYRRLQELSIASHCGMNQPLTAEIHDPVTAIQLWSVVRQLTVPRRDLASWLEDCWRLPSRSRKRGR